MPMNRESDSGFTAALGRHYREILLLAVAALMALKGPDLLIHPRIWAEEVYYLNYALNHDALSSLLYSQPSLGYYLLSANVMTVLAALVSRTIGLEYAAAVTTYLSFAVQLAPYPLLLYSESHLFRSRLLIAGACLVSLLAPTTSGEIWLTSIHTKNWTGLAAFFLLFQDTTGWSPKRIWFYRGALLLCGLSGPYAAVLAPVFALSYFIYRERERLIRAALLGACCLVHLAVFLDQARAGGTAARTSAFTWDSAVVNVFVYQVLGSVMGERASQFWGQRLGLASVLEASISTPRGAPVILAAIGCVVATAVLLMLFWRRLRSQQTLLVVSFLLLGAFTAATALNGVPHNRYAFLPGLAVLLLFMTAWEERGAFRRGLAAILLAGALYVGVRDYQDFWTVYGAGQPAWAGEVERWRADQSYSLAVWPTFFKAHLEWRPDSPVER
ncbi:MAG TPA: hypothetical protein VFY29_16145 [Terriglobia bacterium]|nr:hypothetical protein [Terriglobia bacterium]